MNAPAPCCYSFGSFRLDPLRGKLTDGSRPIELRPKSLAVLQQLVANPQRLLIKDELLSAVWGQVVVTEDSLVQCVREIRQALGDENQHLIRTIPRSGYMFVAAVAQEPVHFDLPAPPDAPRPVHNPSWREHVATIAGKRFAIAALIACAAIAAIVWLSLAMQRDRQAADANGGAAPKSRVSIAVLPLANIGQDPEQQLFADGLTTDLTTDLARIPASLVISHNSVRGYKEKSPDTKTVARQLGVRYVVAGSVQRLDDNVRVNLSLSDTDSGAQLWAERFDGRRSELPRMQADVVRRIAQTLQVQVLEAEADRSLRENALNPNAHDLFLRGWALWERRQPAENVRARDLFAQSVAADPKFALAWVGLANTHLSDLHAAWVDDRQRTLREAEQALERAYAVGPRQREVNAGRGYVLFWQGSIELALAAFDNEIENNPGNALAHVWRGLMLISLGRPAEAIPSIERGIALSPRDQDLNIFYRSMAHAYFSLGRFDQAVTWAEKAIAHSPRYAKGYVFLAAAASLKGDQARAKSALEEFRRLQPKYDSVAAFRAHLMPGEVRMFEATPRFWEALQKAG
jgi:TolB-like protein/DNA-binding winged helix-turn-helix (wHTH) protein/Tfp pilus assembly protein PilF